MTGALDVITLGRDSSSRVVRMTRQSAQRYARMSDAIGGKLVIVQGMFNKGVSASAGTHDEAGAFDTRSWNLTASEQFTYIKQGRILGGADYLRTSAEGFDPHGHCVTIGDAPMHPATAAQVRDYKMGLNALASRRPDTFPFRPTNIGPYIYLEDDMTPDERKELFRIGRRLDEFTKNEVARDQADRNREKERFSQVVTVLGELADDIGTMISHTKDDATRDQLQRAKRKILRKLKDDPDVTGVDNPSDEAMEE